jgi:hypothetical protein
VPAGDTAGHTQAGRATREAMSPGHSRPGPWAG